MSNNNPIGIFDSGLGGLTCVKEVMRLLPNENIIYFGDTLRVPYGTRSAETIVKYVRQDINFLRSFDIKMIIIACGTASATALSVVHNDYNVDILGVVAPACAEAVQLSVNRKIGVLGTRGTINSDKYNQHINSIAADVEVISQACPLFVPLVENGYLQGDIPALVAQEYLEPLKAAGVDTVILGCTHYPLLSDVIRDILGENVRLVDAGRSAAVAAAKRLTSLGLENDSGEVGHVRYFVSDDPDGFAKLGGMFLERKITDDVRKVDIEEF